MAKIKHLSQNSLQEKAIEKAKKYIADENYVDAKDEIEKVLDTNPTDDRALNLLAIVMLKLEQFDRAVKIYEELITRYPKTLPLHTNLGVAYLKNNQYENAIKEFSFVLDKEPDNKTVLKLYGKALLRLNKIDEAIEMFKKAGMDEYAKDLQKKKATSEILESELSTEDIAEDTVGKSVEKNMDVEQQTITSAQQPITDETLTAQETESLIEQDNSEKITEEKVEEQAPIDQQEEFIETERGPSAIEEQELIDEYSGIVDQPQVEETTKNEEQLIEERTISKEEQTVEEEKTTEEQVVKQETETQQSTVTAESNKEEQEVIEENVQEEHKTTVEQKSTPEQTKEGLLSLAEKTSLSRYNATVDFITNSLLSFNLNGNIVYLRDKGIIALSEGLTIEQAYKRYRGKDTKSLFAERKDDPIVLVYGKGILLFETDYNNINELTLRNESMFLEDERLLAFYGDLEWENGRIEVKVDKSINVTQVKGTASIFVGLHHTLRSIEVSTEHYVSIRLNTLVGWYGKLIPKQTSIKHYNNIDYMSFYGEGVVFVDA